MTDVEFFFDPSCPWTWVTSRWVATVARERDLAVTWRPWSLVVKNEGRELPASMPAELRERILSGQGFSTRALRVLQAAGAIAGNQALGQLYTELGRRAHGPGGSYDQSVIDEALDAAGLPADLAGAGDDESWDSGIKDTMAEVGEVVGDDVGVPIVALRSDGSLLAMSGPILAEVPPLERSLLLWDAVATIVGESTIAELKRRRSGGPNPPPLDAAGAVA